GKGSAGPNLPFQRPVQRCSRAPHSGQRRVICASSWTASLRQPSEGKVSQCRGRVSKPPVIELHSRRMVILGLGVDTFGGCCQENECSGHLIEDEREIL